MTTYTAIADADIDPESPGTTTLFTRLRDNPIAITEKASGAPVLANDYITNAMIATNAVNADSIAANAVGTSEIASGVVTSEYGGGLSSGGVGCICVSQPTTSVNDGATISGANLSRRYWATQDTTLSDAAVSSSGTWRNISGQQVGNTDNALFVRVS